MKVTILAFGIARDICGNRRFEIDLAAESDTHVLEQLLFEQFPALKQLASCRLALNEVYVTEPCALQEGDEVALIPPVSGG